MGWYFIPSSRNFAAEKDKNKPVDSSAVLQFSMRWKQTNGIIIIQHNSITPAPLLCSRGSGQFGKQENVLVHIWLRICDAKSSFLCFRALLLTFKWKILFCNWIMKKLAFLGRLNFLFIHIKLESCGIIQKCALWNQTTTIAEFRFKKGFITSLIYCVKYLERLSRIFIIIVSLRFCSVFDFNLLMHVWEVSQYFVSNCSNLGGFTFSPLTVRKIASSRK